MSGRERAQGWRRALHRLSARRAAGPGTVEALGRPGGRTVLLVAGTDEDALRHWRDALAGDRVVVVPPGTGREDLLALLRTTPALDLAVVLRPDAATDPLPSADLAALVLPSLRRGGRYVVDRRCAGDGTAALTQWLGEQTAAAARDARPTESGHVGHVIGPVTETADLLTVTSRRTHLLVVPDAEITALLPVREPGSRVAVLDERPAEVVASRSQVHLHGFGEGTFPAELACPRLETRHYRPADGRAVSLSSRGLAYVGETVLPDSFRWHLTEDPHNFRLAPGARTGLRRVLPAHRPTRHLPGTYYHLDSAHGYHFGHLTTESVGRLWGWDAAKRAYPDLKVVLIHWRHARPRPTLPERFLTAYGIAPDDVVWVDEPVTVDALVGATPMWHQAEPFYAHPDLVEVWDRLAHGFTDGRPDDAPAGMAAGQRLFVSRGSGAKNRECRNQDEVEALFAARGFQVVYPEQHPLAEQVRLFRRARVVAGFGGSGLFNVMYARSLERLIVLNHEGYTARNEHLISSLLGNEQHYLWSAPDRPQPEDGFSHAAFQGGWEFDFARNAAVLDDLLAEG